MKTIKLISAENIKATDVLRTVMENPQQSGANVEQIRRRCKILDALESAKDGMLSLEDADFDFMASTLKSFTFGAATRDLLAIIDAATTPVKTEEKA